MATPTIFTPIAVDPVQLGTSVSTLYTAGASGAILDYITITNDTTTADQVTIYYVNSGGTAGDTNILVKNLTIPGDGSATNILEIINARPFHMEASGTIQGLADTANQFTVHIGGVDYA